MAFSRDHDYYLAKNRSLASAYEIDTKDRKLEKSGHSPLEREASCFNCKGKQKCPEFRARRGGVTSGVVSFGGRGYDICAKYEAAPAERKGMSDGQIKSLMKGFKRGY